MSKYTVKVGHDFEVNEVEVTVEVTVTPSKGGFSLKAAVVAVLTAAVVMSLTASIAYGMATGDYEALKAMADLGKDAVAVVVKAAADTK